MFCPKCGKEIGDNQKFCTNCGAELTENNKQTNNKKDRKFIVISSIVICLSIILIVIGFVLINKSQSLSKSAQNTQKISNLISEYKSIKTISSFDNMSALEALNLIIEQETDLKEFFAQNHKQEEYDNLFNIFFDNLLSFVGRTEEDSSKISFCTDIAYYIDDKNIKNNDIFSFDEEYNKAIKNIKFQVKIDNDSNVTFKIYSPKTEIFSIVNENDDIYRTVIDYNNIEDCFANKLSSVWKNYLAIKKKEFNDKNGSFFSYSIEQLANWMLAQRKFLNEYPDFVLKDIIKEDIRNYFGFMTDSYIIFDCNEDCSYNILVPQAQTVYENFLKNADKNSTEFEAIKEIYYTLKNNNFIVQDSLSNIINEWNETKFKQVEITKEYKNLKYDEKAVAKAYVEARKYCDKHRNDKDENGIYLNAGTGWYEGCIGEFLEKTDKSYAKIDSTIWNYCLETREKSEGMAGVRTCYIEEYEKMGNTIKSETTKTMNTDIPLLNNNITSISTEMKRYLLSVGKIFSNNWDKANVIGTGICTIEFVIDSNGIINKKEIVEESSNKTLDESVKETLSKTRDLGMPPTEYNGERIRISFEIKGDKFKLYYP